MDTNVNRLVKSQSPETCTHPDVGELLLDYIVDLLAERAAEEVEDHLLDCPYCEERYETILGMRSATRRPETAHDVESDVDSAHLRAPFGAKVLNLADFKKRRS